MGELVEVMKILNLASPGHEELPMRLIKDNLDILGERIITICNASFIQGVFPTQLKRAKVVPIFKSGDRKDIKNYRPISILNSFNKILEKIAYLQLYYYLTSNNILTRCQYGFRTGYSTENAINNMLTQLYNALDNRQYTVCVMIDLSKAFDTLNRIILINKLEYYGIQGVSLQWFESYLSARDQFVSINGKASDIRGVELGVAQGSSLGPLLFNLYINDLVHSSNFFQYFLYADDTSLLASSPNLHELIAQINVELNNVCNWFHCNQLTINASKSNCITFRRRLQIPPDTPPIIMGGVEIKNVSCCRFLGAYIDEHLKFDAHIQFMVNKASKYISFL